MKVTIVPVDNIVIVDGVPANVSMDGVNDTIHAIQHNGIDGRVEYKGGKSKIFNDISQFQFLIDRHAESVFEQEQRAANPYYGLSESEKKIKAYENKLAAIDSNRDKLLTKDNTFEFDGRNVYADGLLIIGQLAGLIYQPVGYTFDLKTADKMADNISNVFITLDHDKIIELGKKYNNYVDSVWSKGESFKKSLKDIMNNKQKKSPDIINFDTDTGW